MSPTGAPPEQPAGGLASDGRPGGSPAQAATGTAWNGSKQTAAWGMDRAQGSRQMVSMSMAIACTWVQRSGPSRTSQPRHTALARAISGPDAERGTNSRGDARQAAATAHDRSTSAS